MSEDYKRPSRWLARSLAKPKGWRSGFTIVGLVGLLLASDPFGCRLLPIYHQARFGQRYRQVLHQTNPIRRNAPYGREQYWALDARAGQAVTITAQSYEFDPYLILISPTGQEIAWSDDSGGFFNARISTTLPVSGRYTIVICGLNADQYGTYWLSIEEGDQPMVWGETAAFAYYDRGMAWAERKQNRRARSWLNLAMGRYFRQHRQWKRAEAYYARSLAAAQRAGFTYGRWAVALERGILLKERHHYDRAIDQLERALEMSRDLRAADWAEAVTAIQLGDLYRYIDRAELTATYYRKATDYLQSFERSSTTAQLYITLSEFRLLQDREKALEYARKAYDLRAGIDPALAVRAALTLATANMVSHRPEEGFTLMQQARDMAHRLGYRDQEVAALTLMSLEYFRRGDVDAMIRSARQAVALTRPDDEDPNPRRRALQLQAQGEMLRGNHEAALQLALEALQVTEAAWAREPIEELRQRYLSQSKAVSTQVIANLSALSKRRPDREYAEQAFDFAERSRCLALLHQLVTSKAERASIVDARLLERERELLKRISTLGRRLVFLKAQGNLDPLTVQQLESERARLVADRMQLDARLRRLAGNRYDAALLSPLTAGEVRKRFLATHPRTAILFYQLGPRESFLIILRRDGAHLFKLAGWHIIGKAVTEWRAAIGRQLKPRRPMEEMVKEYARVAHRLYDLLIRPAASVIRGYDLVIVPDESLYQLAFESLVVSAPERATRFDELRYLVHDHAISYAPSISVLAEVERRERVVMAASTGMRRLLLVGDPVFSERDPRLAGRQRPSEERESEVARLREPRLRSGVYRLPATRKEVLSIARLAERARWRAKVWLGFQASERNLKADDLSAYRLIHFATHAMADPVEGDFSGIILTLGDEPPDDDGVLTAAEIERLRLNADLVVLSACDTGSGQATHAEGVIGLSRAFLLAGARDICASLWSVEDESTRRLMISFYRRLLMRGQSISRALQRAKLDVLGQGAAPFFWAPFVLVGPPDGPSEAVR